MKKIILTSITLILFYTNIFAQFIPTSDQIDCHLAWHHPNWGRAGSIDFYSVSGGVITATYNIGTYNGEQSYINTTEIGLQSGVSYFTGSMTVEIGPVNATTGIGPISIISFEVTGNEPFPDYGNLTELLINAPAVGTIDFSGIINGTSEVADAEIPHDLIVFGTGPLGDTIQVNGPSHMHWGSAEGCSSLVSSVPTMSEWGLIILSLLLLTLGSVSIIRQRQTALLTANGTNLKLEMPLFNERIFRKIAMKSIPFTVVAIAIISMIEGGIFTRNLVGTIISGLIISYLIHFVLMSEKLEELKE